MVSRSPMETTVEQAMEVTAIVSPHIVGLEVVEASIVTRCHGNNKNSKPSFFLGVTLVPSFIFQGLIKTFIFLNFGVSFPQSVENFPKIVKKDHSPKVFRNSQYFPKSIGKDGRGVEPPRCVEDHPTGWFSG